MGAQKLNFSFFYWPFELIKYLMELYLKLAKFIYSF